MTNETREVDPTGRRLPTFLLIGAMKAGTTSLYHYLSAHPQVATTPYKAPEFFVAESNWHRGIDWYRQQFPVTDGHVLAVGEASNAYAKFPRHRGVPERIAAHLPDVRLVYVVRDPIAGSARTTRPRSPRAARRPRSSTAVFANHIYLDYSRYAMQVEQYLEHFPRDQILIITSEDLRSSRETTVQKVYEFVGVDPEFAPADLDRDFYLTKDRAVRSPGPARAAEVPQAPLSLDPAVQGTREQHDRRAPAGHPPAAAQARGRGGRHHRRGAGRARGRAGGRRPATEDVPGPGLRRLGHRLTTGQPTAATDRRSSAATSGGVNHAGSSSPCANRRRCSVPEIRKACWPGATSSSGT